MLDPANGRGIPTCPRHFRGRRAEWPDDATCRNARRRCAVPPGARREQKRPAPNRKGRCRRVATREDPKRAPAAAGVATQRGRLLLRAGETDGTGTANRAPCSGNRRVVSMWRKSRDPGDKYLVLTPEPGTCGQLTTPSSASLVRPSRPRGAPQTQ